MSGAGAVQALFARAALDGVDPYVAQVLGTALVTGLMGVALAQGAQIVLRRVRATSAAGDATIDAPAPVATARRAAAAAFLREVERAAERATAGTTMRVSTSHTPATQMQPRTAPVATTDDARSAPSVRARLATLAGGLRGRVVSRVAPQIATASRAGAARGAAPVRTAQALAAAGLSRAEIARRTGLSQDAVGLALALAS